MSRRRIAILGGLGFIGSHFCRAFLKSGAQIRVFDKLYTSRSLVADIEDQIEIVEGDAARPDDVLGAVADADIIIHLVHTTVPGTSMNDPGYDVISNVAASANWLKDLHKCKVSQLLYFSSGGTIYGIPQSSLISEDHPTNPISSYGITKLAIEKYVAMYCASYGITYRIIRPSNVYGVGQKLHTKQGLIGVLIHRALTGQPLEVWGDGLNQRDYLHMDDLTVAVTALLDYKGSHTTFNVSSGMGASILDIIQILNKYLELPQVLCMPARGFDVPINILDNSRLQTETGWKPSVDLETGIMRVIEWIRDLQQL